MILYTCGVKNIGGWMGHPCAKAANALKQAGYDYELKTVKGFKNIPGTNKPEYREGIRQLSGQDLVPILVLDNGDVISDSGEIVKWAKANPA